jgi:ketosteroid isomerase-like protein
MPENVEIVRRAFEAFNRRDFDAALQDVAPDAAVDMSRSLGPEAGVYVGHDAIRRLWREMTEPFELHTISPQEIVDHGEEVVVQLTAQMRGRDGIELEAHSATVVAMRDGQLVRWTMYQDTAEALEALDRQQ